jgi:hypothetical protein
MRLPICSHEKEVSALLQGGQWPAGCVAELRAHVTGCRVCSDLVLVTEAFRAARARSTGVAALNSPGLLWWRAQLRKRNAAVERVSKPFFGAQVFALSIYVLAAAGFVVSQARHGLRWLEWLADLPQAKAFHMEVLLPAANAAGKPEWTLMTVLPGLALLALFSGVILYFATDKH